jgi:hypothetical protein
MLLTDICTRIVCAETAGILYIHIDVINVKIVLMLRGVCNECSRLIYLPDPDYSLLQFSPGMGRLLPSAGIQRWLA